MRRRIKQSLMGLCTLALLLGMLSGCSAPDRQNSQSEPDMGSGQTNLASMMSSGNISDTNAMEEKSDYLSEEAGTPEDESLAEEAAQADRKLITTMNISAETKEFDAAMEAIETRVKELGGYIENMETYNGSQYYRTINTRYARMTIRIPKDALDGFLNTVYGITNVISKNKNVEDVTLTYVDLASHKESLETEQTRLLQLLEKAETIEDIITIEQRLSNVRYQIESMESRLRTYDNKVDYSTVYLNIDEVQELTPVVDETIWQQISGGFITSLKDIGNGCKEILIWLVVNSPYLILWAAAIVLIVLLTRRRMRKPQSKKQEPAPNQKGTNTND